VLAVIGATGVALHEYAPAAVKLAAVGHGQADKDAIVWGVGRRLGLAEPLATDAADALALALCHLQHAPLLAALDAADGRAAAVARGPGARQRGGFIVIAALAGTLSEKSPERLVVDVGGVGYALHASLRTFSTCRPRVNPCGSSSTPRSARTRSSSSVFATAEERALFHLLRKVKGLGPRTALGVLSGMPRRDLLARSRRATPRVSRPSPEWGRSSPSGSSSSAGSRQRCSPPATHRARSPRRERGRRGGGLGPREPRVQADQAERAVERAAAPAAPLEEVIRAALKGLGAGLGA